mmetsp:Transcript_7091/g.5054  ORF Transcript_7091/g.5054 Transcript_7091/m.5054 type:complete len:182 (-) Transcript_7091:354-899(-)
MEKTSFDFALFFLSLQLFIMFTVIYFILPEQYNNLVELLAQQYDEEDCCPDYKLEKINFKLLLKDKHSILGISSLFMGNYAVSFILPVLSNELINYGVNNMGVSGIATLGNFCSAVSLLIGKVIITKLNERVLLATMLFLTGFSISMYGPSDWFHYPNELYLIILGRTFTSLFAGFVLISS